jgi:hypothetical protein
MSIRRASVPAVASLALLLGGCGALGDERSPTASDTRATDKPGNGGKDSGTTDPSPSDSGTDEPSGETSTVPVYFVGETPQGPRLYREFQRVQGDPMTAAAELLTSGDTLDPDYRSLFPGGAFESVSYDEAAGVIVAAVPDDGWTTPADGMSSADAKLAVQQLVYTLQGVAQTRAPLVVTLGGERVPLFGVETADGVRNADPIRTLALVNVTTPGEGETVSGTFTATGVASSFEANVPWEVRQDGEVVMDGFATAEGWMDKLYPWQVDVDVSMLEPGTYEFVARTDDPSDGEGFGPSEDTKTFFVE